MFLISGWLGMKYTWIGSEEGLIWGVYRGGISEGIEWGVRVCDD